MTIILSHKIYCKLYNAACITDPRLCGAAGGAVSFWLKIITCTNLDGIISSRGHNKKGFVIHCDSNKIVYAVHFIILDIYQNIQPPLYEWYCMITIFSQCYYQNVDMSMSVWESHWSYVTQNKFWLGRWPYERVPNRMGEENPEGKTTRHRLWRVIDIPHVCHNVSFNVILKDQWWMFSMY